MDDRKAPADPLLDELATIGLRVARVVATISEAQERTVAAATAWLVEPPATPASLDQATRIGQGIDAAEQAIADAIPRVATLSQAYDRIARAVRRTRALACRIEQGWPTPRSTTDDRRAMLLRRAARAVGQVIRARTEGDPDMRERLFDDLAARLDDPTLDLRFLERPIAALVRHLCQALGLTEEAATAPASEAPPPGRRHDPG